MIRNRAACSPSFRYHVAATSNCIVVQQCHLATMSFPLDGVSQSLSRNTHRHFN
ncbi:hypothetical protein CIPAW_02G009400 [Carya illinoinensis]|uniref:Uncharacterized protein n=1 Tax=Carya illinoinensis TaxID=32201 RepID=A0A8T1RA02_CARIL|nr:hypothetical protein CIPAW_02G009400 [Carya illinoinensis]